MDTSWLGLLGAGLATFLSPCVLPLAPILIASWASAGSGRFSRVRSTAVFSTGFTLAFVMMGSGVSAVSDLVTPVKPYLFILAAFVLALYGLRMTGIIEPSGRLSFLSRSLVLPDFSKKISGSLSGLLFGVIFGLSWTPCVGPILGGVLTYVASKESSALRGGAMLFVFSLGISLPLLALAAFSERLKPTLQRFRKWIPRMEQATGVGLLIFSALLVNQFRFTSTPVAPTTSPLYAMDHHGERVAIGKARDNSQTQMLFFHSTNCPICHAMETFLPEFEKDCSSAGFLLTKINVDDPANYAVSNRYRIRAVPTISLISPEGVEVAHLVGFQSSWTLREAARKTTGTFCSDGSFNEKNLPEGKTCTVGKSC